MGFNYEEVEEEESEEDEPLNSFRAYFSPASHSLLQEQQQQKKALRHHSLQMVHDKSQSANNLVSFIDNMQLTVSEPNALNQISSATPEPSIQAEPTPVKAIRSNVNSSSGYFPLEPTLEECLDGLDISYEAAHSTNTETSSDEIAKPPRQAISDE